MSDADTGASESIEFAQLSERCWRVQDGEFLLQGAEVAWPHSLHSDFVLPNGRILHRPSAYYLVSASGELLHAYARPYAYSLEDTLYILDIHAVFEDRLSKFLWVWHWKQEPRIEETGVLLRDLVECDRKDLPFDPLRIPAQ